MKTPQMCSGGRCGSTDVQHDLFGSGHDLDLRSNFQHDLSRSTDSSFDASWREEHDAGKIKCVQGLSQKLLQKQRFIKKKLAILAPGVKTVDGRSNLRELLRKSVNRAIKWAFRGAVALLVSELCVDLLKIVDIWPTNRRILTFSDLWWLDLWPDQKSDRSDFFLIFDALSNAACPVSLRGPGAELEGGVETHTPSRAWKSRSPSGARVKPKGNSCCGDWCVLFS